MAKKTTTPAGSKPAKPKTDAPSERRKVDEEIRKLEERQASRAIDRAIRWARLADQLETLLDRADDLFTHGLPVDIEDVKRFHADLQSDFVELEGCTLGDARRWLVLSTESTLAVDLQLAENWLPMIGFEYRTQDAYAIADVRLRLEGKPHDLMTTNSEAIVYAISQVRKLLRADLARSKSFDRAPSEEDLDVLQRLRDKPKTAKELAVEIAGKDNSHNMDEPRVARAIERLKKVHGFDLPNERGFGYALTPSDRARLDAFDRGT
jgi:hypothetical protein